MLVEIHRENERGDVITLRQNICVVRDGKTLFVPAGFESDGASVPRFLWASVTPAIDHRTIRGAIVHDYLYRRTPAGWTRKEADELFYDLIREDGLGWWASQKAYWGVRLFGWTAYKSGQEMLNGGTS